MYFRYNRMQNWDRGEEIIASRICSRVKQTVAAALTQHARTPPGRARPPKIKASQIKLNAFHPLSVYSDVCVLVGASVCCLERQNADSRQEQTRAYLLLAYVDFPELASSSSREFGNVKAFIFTILF